jgi:CRP-like cAMP-binding protein
MATSFATVTTSASEFSYDLRNPPQQAAHHGLTVVATPASVLPLQDSTIDMHSPLNRFMPGKSRREYQAGASIFSQGDMANSVFYIQSGNVKLTVVSSSGKEAVIAHLTAGSFFGEASIGGELQRASSASALQACTIIRIEKMAMLDLLHREPEFALEFRAHLLSRNMRMQSDLVDHLFNSSEKRLARLLMLMANFGQATEPIPVIAKISQETLADMIGTTRSRVSFFLNRFRSLGYIDYNSDGMVVDSSLVNIVLND